MLYKKFFILILFIGLGISAHIVSFLKDKDINNDYHIHLAHAGEIYDPDALAQYFFSYHRYKYNTQKVIPGSTLLLLMKDRFLNNENIEKITGYFMEDNEVKFKVPFLKYKDDSYYALVPISHNVKPGQYEFNVEFMYNEDLLEKERRILQNSAIKLDIQQRSFYKEEVKLNKKLARRKATPASPEVIQEAEEIWEVTATVNDKARYALSDFILPVEEYKYVTGMFADRRIYTYMDGNVISGTAHGGIDIAAKTGTPVYASATGKVVLAKKRIVTGNSVVLEHFPGMFTMYYHMDSISVKKGDIVMKGTKVGEVGNTGFSTGPHLHWEMRVNNIRVDPLLALGELDNIRTIDIIVSRNTSY